MGRDDQKRDEIHGVVSGTVSGPVAIGRDIRQTQSVGTMSVQVTEAELDELRQEFVHLRQQVIETTPPEVCDKALEMVDELEKDTVAEQPKPITMRYVRDWFAANVPRLAGAVTGLVVHPIVGKLVEAAGEAVAGQFKQLFESG